jgi:hypothetical protein
MKVTEAQVLLAAKPIAGRAPALFRDFTTLFGVSPRVCAAVITTTPFDDSVKIVHVLWTLLFLKTYAKEAVLLSIAGAKDRKTYRQYIWKVMDSFSQKTRDIVCCHKCRHAAVALVYYVYALTSLSTRFNGTTDSKEIEERHAR